MNSAVYRVFFLPSFSSSAARDGRSLLVFFVRFYVNGFVSMLALMFCSKNHPRVLPSFDFQQPPTASFWFLSCIANWIKID